MVEKQQQRRTAFPADYLEREGEKRISKIAQLSLINKSITARCFAPPQHPTSGRGLKKKTFTTTLEKGNITFFTWMKKQRGQRTISSGSQKTEQRLKKNTLSVLVQHWRSSWKPEIISCVMITEHHMGERRGWESLSASHKNPHSNKPGEGVFPADFFPHHLFERVGHQTSKYAA